MKKTINLRVTIDDEVPYVEEGVRQSFDETEYIHLLVRDMPWTVGAVILRNNGFGHLLPDEDTRQEL